MEHIKDCDLVIQDMDNISVRVKNVMKVLNVRTIQDLKIMQLTDTLPVPGTVIRYYPIIGSQLTYSNKVNTEVKHILREYADKQQSNE